MINKLKISLLSIIFLVNIDLFSQDNFDSQGNRYKSGVSNILNAENPEDIGIRNADKFRKIKMTRLYMDMLTIKMFYGQQLFGKLLI